MSILRQIFGPSKKEIWAQISDEIGGEYIETGFWGKDCLIYQSGEWQVVLDNYTVSTGRSSVTYTRMRAPFLNKDKFYFKVYREGFFSTIGKVFGMQDIEIGDRFFDENFIIKANNEEKINLVLKDSEIKRLINSVPHIYFELKDDEGFFGKAFPGGVDELYFQCTGVIKDREVLKNLFDLFAITLDRLVQIDSAYEDDPNFKLY